MNITIRQARKDDWQVIQKLNHEVYESSVEYDDRLDLDEPFSESGAKGYQDNVINDFCIIAEDNGKPVGYLVGGPKSFNYRKVKLGEIFHMGVSPNYRRSGIGSQLIDTFRMWCKEKGIERIFVSAYYDNADTVNFYKKQGLKPFGIELEGDV